MRKFKSAKSTNVQKSMAAMRYGAVSLVTPQASENATIDSASSFGSRR